MPVDTVKLAICNLALGHLAKGTITDPDDATDIVAVECARVWPIALKEALRGHDWPFNTAIEALKLISPAAAWVTLTVYAVGDFITINSLTYKCLVAHTAGTFATDLTAGKWVLYTAYVPLHWLYSYDPPSTSVAVWHVYNESTKDPEVGEEFRLIYDSVNDKEVIITNCSDAYVEYSYYVTNTSLFDSNFVTAMGYRLAAELAMGMLGLPEMAKAMSDGYLAAVNDAERMSSYESNDKNPQKSSLLDARQ